MQGDFYGDQLQGSFVRKLLEDLTPNRPFAYETSSSLSLRDHTGLKSEPLLEAKASAAIIDHAAFVFIDAIDPLGTVNPRSHERMGRVFDRLKPYYQHLGGDRVRDVAIFYSPESKFNFAGSGRHVSGLETTDTHTEACMGAARTILGHHLPLGVLTRDSLQNLSGVKVLLLPNVNMMDEEECATIREWVRNGGNLYASGGTSLVDKKGRMRDDFMLSDVFGVSLNARPDWKDHVHFLSPAAAGQDLFPEHSAQYPAFTSGKGLKVRAHQGSQELATTTLPWPSSEPSRFASIHSDPPWQATDNPEIVAHQYGQGKVIYCSSLLENLEPLSETFVRVLRRLHNGFRFEADAPAAVEVTMFHQPERKRYVLGLVNFQKDMPNLPVEGIAVRLRLREKVSAIERLPEGRKVEHISRQGVVSFTISKLETLAMYAVRV